MGNHSINMNFDISKSHMSCRFDSNCPLEARAYSFGCALWTGLVGVALGCVVAVKTVIDVALGIISGIGSIACGRKNRKLNDFCDNRFKDAYNDVINLFVLASTPIGYALGVLDPKIPQGMFPAIDKLYA